MSTDEITKLRRQLREVTENEITYLRAENQALRAALAKAEAAARAAK